VLAGFSQTVSLLLLLLLLLLFVLLVVLLLLLLLVVVFADKGSTSDPLCLSCIYDPLQTTDVRLCVLILQLTVNGQGLGF